MIIWVWFYGKGSCAGFFSDGDEVELIKRHTAVSRYVESCSRGEIPIGFVVPKKACAFVMWALPMLASVLEAGSSGSEFPVRRAAIFTLFFVWNRYEAFVKKKWLVCFCGMFRSQCNAWKVCTQDVLDFAKMFLWLRRCGVYTKICLPKEFGRLSIFLILPIIKRQLVFQ